VASAIADDAVNFKGKIPAPRKKSYCEGTLVREKGGREKELNFLQKLLAEEETG